MRGHFYHMQCCLVTQLTHTIFICFQGNQAKKLTKGQILICKKGKRFLLTLSPHHLNSYLEQSLRSLSNVPLKNSFLHLLPDSNVSQSGIIYRHGHGHHQAPSLQQPRLKLSGPWCHACLPPPWPPVSSPLQSPSVGSSLTHTHTHKYTRDLFPWTCVTLKDYPSPGPHY